MILIYIIYDCRMKKWITKKIKLQNKINFLEVQKEFYIKEKKIYWGI